MQIAGLQNLSLVDFSGYLSSVVFTKGCNFKCGYCHNPDLVGTTSPHIVTEEEIFSFLNHRRNMIEGVVVSGGEPTLQTDLKDFLIKIKEEKFQTKLDTNGSNPDIVEELLRERLLDYLAIDIKTSLDNYSMVTDVKDIKAKIQRSISLATLSTVQHEFRVTCAPGIVEEKDIVSIGQMLKGAKRCFLQQFRPISTYDKKYEEIIPYSKEKLFEFKAILEKDINHVEIRGV